MRAFPKGGMKMDSHIELDKFEYMFLSYVDKSLDYKSMELRKKVLKIKNRELLTLNSPLTDEPHGEEQLDYLEDAKALGDEQRILMIDIDRALNTLSDTDKYVIVQLFFDEHPQKELADYMHVNQSTISRIKKKALKKLKEILKTEALH